VHAWVFVYVTCSCIAENFGILLSLSLHIDSVCVCVNVHGYFFSSFDLLVFYG
jgi:hypothetical protein